MTSRIAWTIIAASILLIVGLSAATARGIEPSDAWWLTVGGWTAEPTVTLPGGMPVEMDHGGCS